MQYATVEELEGRWRPLSGDEADRAEVLLADAATRINIAFRENGKEIDQSDETLAAVLSMVSCEMVKRVMASSVDADCTQSTMTAGSYSQSYTFSNSPGSMYISKDERAMLGISKKPQRIVSLSPAGELR